MLSVVIPCYNEESRIRKNLPRIIEYLEKEYPNYELIIIIDLGKDRTLDIAKKLGNKKTKIIVNKKRMGKGYAVRQGVMKAKGDYIFFLDIDLSAPIEELPKLFKYLNEYDVVIGSRALNKSHVKKRIDRKILGFLGNLLIQLFLFKGIKDTQCGFKIFRREAAKRLFALQQNTGFGFDFEIIFLAHKFGYKVREVPIRWSHVGGSKVTFASHFATLAEFAKIKINDWKGAYKTDKGVRVL
jgi:dolichyl-phosphate beta-glucosyltransferase